MTTISASIIIQRPIQEVFAFLTDARNNLLWQSNTGLQSISQMPEDPVGVGTRITESWQFMGRTSQSTSEVVEYEPSHKYVRRLIAGSSPIKQGAYMLEPVAGGARWTFTAMVQAAGLFAIAEPLLASNLKRGMEASMAEARTQIERAA